MSAFNQPGSPPAPHLFALQLALECIAIDPHRRLRPVPCANPDEMPRCLVITDGTHVESYLAADLPPDVLDALDRLTAEQRLRDPAAVLQWLGGDPPNTFLTYTFPVPLTAAQYPAAVRHPEPNEIGRPVFAIIVDERVVAACTSARENDHCAEASVWTAPDLQRRGYARQVTAAWAHHLQQQDKVPIYSHVVENLPSAGVARSLGLRLIFTEVVY